MTKSKKKLSTWLRSGVIEKNFKHSLDLTLDALHDACPLDISRRSLRDSLHDIIYHDTNFRQICQAHNTLFDWFVKQKSSSTSSTSSRQSKRTIVFNKSRLQSSTVYGPSETINHNNITTTRASSPPINQAFSFNENEQGAIVEPFINSAEETAYEFLVKNESIIPSEIVEKFVAKQRPPISKDFRNADLLCMLNFIIENIKIFSKKSLFHGKYKANPTELLMNFKKNVRHKVAHGIVINGKGRWCDHSLQDVSILACEVIVCLGGNYEEALSNKENIDKEIVRRWVNKDLQKRKLDEVLSDKENLNAPQKRRLGNPNFGKMTEFVLNTLEELEETEKGSKKKILELTMNENEYITKFWESVRTEERKEQVRRFIQFTNLMFEVVKLKDEKLRVKGVVSRFLPDSGGLAEDKRSSLFQQEMMVPSHFERLSKQRSSIFENYA
ncbi:unnamed protein product [Rhizophagus irregularis]|uniref:Uncharacterized protein n=1 Tax=Rhizophagus irregularis TaxID=588596 RepID=A0A915ZMA8_9GLOM|nr:unnamed protein product [Rhizophagus irregularis]CAB5379923.1 unnamed protein product [Rhizophagus irregularis]